MKKLISQILIVGLFGSLVYFVPSISATDYVFTEIKDPDYPNDYFTSGTGITDNGKIVGYNSGGHSFIIDGENFIRFEYSGATETVAQDINESGQTTGIFNGNHSFICDDEGCIEITPTDNAYAYGINNDGHVVGYYNGSGYLGFLYDGSSYSTIQYPGALYNYATGINNDGVIVGYHSYGSMTHGFLYDGGYTTFAYPGAAYTYPHDINDAGHIVGFYQKANGIPYSGFLYDGDSYIKIDYPGAYQTFIKGINNQGQLVGFYKTSGGFEYFGFLATPASLIPNANFTAYPTSGEAPLTVTFTDESTGTIDSWEWDFGDNSNSTNQNPIHIYSNSGTYTVSLTVIGPYGSDTEAKIDYITVNYPAPVANFTANPISGVHPLSVIFTDQSTGNITSWSWAFGDGLGSSTQQNPSYTYNDPGTYTVSLTVNGPGGTDTETKTDYIVVEHETPVANFTADNTIGDAPLIVNFSDESTGDINSCLWNFGDGETSIEENPTHTYTDEGIYNVSLSVSGPHGNDTEVKLGYITVSEPDDDNGDGGGGGCFISTPFLGICPISQHRED